jgi:hypothetical protein
MKAGTETRPRDQVSCGWKPAHVDADFRHDDARDGTPDGGNGHQSVDGGLEGREGRVTQARLHVVHSDLERVDLCQMQPEQESVMRF